MFLNKMSRGKAGVRDLAIGGGLSIAHWNVNGIKSQVYGLKSEDEGFREVIKNNDIIFSQQKLMHQKI